MLQFTLISALPPNYGPNEGKMIMKQIKILLHNQWLREYKGGVHGAPINLSQGSSRGHTKYRRFHLAHVCQLLCIKQDHATVPISNQPIQWRHRELGWWHRSPVLYTTWSCTRLSLDQSLEIRPRQTSVLCPRPEKYTYTVLPFGPVNTPPFHTVMIRSFQIE